MKRCMIQTPTRNLATYYYNLVINIDGTISPLPFDAKRQGPWYFDGQVYYQKRGN